jgi:hypothetical protein
MSRPRNGRAVHSFIIAARLMEPIRASCRTLISQGQNTKYSIPVDVFRFATKLGNCSVQSALRICATGSRQSHSITSSARASTGGGMMTPNALAVFRLTTIKYLDACSTGKSPGLMPLKILSI